MERCQWFVRFFPGAGLNPDKDVTIRAIGAEGTSILTAFEKGEIDAFSGGAHDLISLYGRGFKSKSLLPEEYKTIPTTGIIANGKIMKENPEVVEKVFSCHRESNRLCH